MRFGDWPNDNISKIVVCFPNKILYIYGGHIVVSEFITGKFKIQLLTRHFDSLHWNTSFPAVTVCEIFNGEKNWDLSERFD